MVQQLENELLEDKDDSIELSIEQEEELLKSPKSPNEKRLKSVIIRPELNIKKKLLEKFKIKNPSKPEHFNPFSKKYRFIEKFKKKSESDNNNKNLNKTPHKSLRLVEKNRQQLRSYKQSHRLQLNAHSSNSPSHKHHHSHNQKTQIHSHHHSKKSPKRSHQRTYYRKSPSQSLRIRTHLDKSPTHSHSKQNTRQKSPIPRTHQSKEIAQKKEEDNHQRSSPPHAQTQRIDKAQLPLVATTIVNKQLSTQQSPQECRIVPNLQIEIDNNIQPPAVNANTRIIELKNKNVPAGIQLAIAVETNKRYSKNALKKITRKLISEL